MNSSSSSSNESTLNNQTHDNALRALGLDRSATPSDIKGAYRSLALTYHPDKVTGSEVSKRAAQDRFSTISAAYEALTSGAQTPSVVYYGPVAPYPEPYQFQTNCFDNIPLRIPSHVLFGNNSMGNNEPGRQIAGYLTNEPAQALPAASDVSMMDVSVTEASPQTIPAAVTQSTLKRRPVVMTEEFAGPAAKRQRRGQDSFQPQSLPTIVSFGHHDGMKRPAFQMDNLRSYDSPYHPAKRQRTVCA